MQLNQNQLDLIKKIFQRGNARAYLKFLNDIVNPILDQFEIASDNDSVEARLSLFFGLNYRDVFVYKASERFYMPGKLRNHMWIEVEDLKKFRKVRSGDCVIIRYDRRDPSRVEAQIVSDFVTDTEDRRIFLLTVEQYYKIRSKFKGERLV